MEKGKNIMVLVEKSYEGDYLNGKKWNGKGYNYNSNMIFEIKNGKGEIKEYNDNCILILEGEYKWRKKRKRKEFYSGILIFEGEYLNEKKWNGDG